MNLNCLFLVLVTVESGCVQRSPVQVGLNEFSSVVHL